MDQIERLQSVTQFNSQRGQMTLHPLVSVLDQSKSSPIKPKICFGVHTSEVAPTSLVFNGCLTAQKNQNN